MPKIAVAGVKEDTGREFLNLLAENDFATDKVFALEARAPLGTVVSYGEDDELDVYALEEFDFKKVDVLVFAATKEQGKRYIKKAVSAGVKVIDLSGATFTDSDVPYVIEEINGDLINKETKVVGVPTSTVYQTLLPLAKTIKNHRLKRLVVNVFCSTSYLGRPAMDELFSQSRKIFLNETLADNQEVFKKQIAFNVLPQVGEFIGDETALEWAINAEIKKILKNDIKVHANCAFVPTFIGDGAFVNAEFDDEVDAGDIREQMKTVKNVVVFDKTVDGGYVSVDDVQGEDSVYVSRVRQDVSVDNGISFWSVADNLRAGSARAAFATLKHWM
ncbi:MAG: aspartate-semialdehyde dehydrogenase [Alphaproteobacteria bacterium]|nr:aspartate-semialdehyde dehydrogenase [Alphaproteobacteria bacterium]